ncbi:MAG: GNAT family N-acetyltransferase [Gaiellales bacterium]
MTPAGVELVDPGRDEALLRQVADVAYATQPEWERSVGFMLASFDFDPGLQRRLAVLDGAPVGYATCGLIWMLAPDTPYAWGEVGVVAEARGQGVGSALLAWTQERARAIGKTGVQVPCSSARPAAIGFLERRGFVEYDRMAGVELALAGLERPVVAMPEGVRLVSLADEPALIDSLYAACCEIYADLPDPEPVAIGTFEEWRVRDVEAGGQPLDGVLVAVAGDDVVGMTRLVMQERGRSVSHMITGVRRAWRGRGIALALKRAAIGWAIDRGAERMTAENALHNAPMRAINEALGFQPGADFVELRGPAAG